MYLARLTMVYRMTEQQKTVTVNGERVPLTDIAGFECVFATYSANKLMDTDALVVKEKVHFKDGRVVPNIRVHRDKKWPYYITREGFRNHKDKKEWEDIHRLERRTSRRIDLARNVAKAMGKPLDQTMRQLGDSPYLYGTDILPSSLIKDMYEKKWPEAKTLTFDVAALDNEADIVDGTDDITISNIVYKDKAYTAVTKQYVGNIDNFIEKVLKKAEETMGDRIKARNLKWEIDIVDNAGEAVWRVLQKAHEWKPDFISIWNMRYDIPKMVDALTKYNYNVADAFSDPSVPEEYRLFNWREGPAIKVTQSGKKLPLHVAERWHVCTCTASFYFVDAMCLYKRIRTAEGNESSYALDHILKVKGIPSKLKSEELSHLEGDSNAWHVEAQKNHRVFYTVYNLQDDIALLDLDNKIGDISRAFPGLAGISDYSLFTRQPRKIADDLHFYVLDKGKVIASTPQDIANDPLNKYVLGLGDWIITLPSYMIDNGMYAFKDAPNIRTMIYRYLADLDIAATYPTGEDTLNISKETTKFETSLFKGFTEQERRYFGLTLTTGKSSALELGVRYLKMPTPEQLVAQYDEDFKDAA